MGRTLLDLQFDGATPYNSAATALTTTAAGAAIKSADEGFVLAATSRVKVTGEDLGSLDTFTVSAIVRPGKFGRRQVLLESQSPPLRIYLTATGVVKGGVNTAAGWQEISSGRPLPKGKESVVRMSRDAKGVLRLEVNGKASAEKAVGGLEAAGRAGLTIGTDVKGASGFAGVIAALTLNDTAITLAGEQTLARKASKLEGRLKTVYGANVSVYLDVPTVDSRFNQIKSIMRAAGVEDLSSLSTLRIDRHTKLTPGTMLKASSAAGGLGVVNWGAVAKDFVKLAQTDSVGARRVVDGSLLARDVVLSPGTSFKDVPVIRRTPLSVLATQPAGTLSLQPRTATASLTFTPVALSSTSLATTARTPEPTSFMAPVPIPTTSFIRTIPGAIAIGLGDTGRSISGDAIRDGASDVALDPGITERLTAGEAIERLKRDRPWDWPVMGDPEPIQVRSNVMPINSAVIIARRLDLTNQTLEIDPAVGTLYIICEEIEAANGAKITWKRPVLDVPNIGYDPSLDGNPDWSGVHTGGSKHGLPGGDARSGAAGLPGRAGYSAPNVEVWVLRINGMPDIDLEGQDGGQGGRGQQGGRGGRGAQGQPGKWYWAFGRHCWENPGDGGNGGRGGSGGRGGQGGRGGDGGDILFATLEASLAALTTSNAFEADLGAGRPGSGGDGGHRGEGGQGGPRGYTEVCGGGRAGAQGQPGNVGARGDAGAGGGLGQMRIMTITQEAWDEQMTRPWLYDVTPDATLPDQPVVLKGSRFADTDRVMIGTRVLAATPRPDEGLSVHIPADMTGGTHQLFLRRHDGQESNRLPLIVKPQITGALPVVSPGTDTLVDGRAFLPGATVDYDGAIYPATVNPSRRQLTFRVPETVAKNSAESEVSLTVINPDGQRSNTVRAVVPHVLRTGFTLGVHDYNFANDSDGRPSWSTFEDTYGSVEVWHELLDPVFGHPVLTTAYYFFYEHFLKGTANGGLATGFCTSLASMALDRFWLGKNDTFTAINRDNAFRKTMTAVHGRLLTRECLVDFHEQGRNGQANVVSSFRRIESAFTSGGTRESAPLLFFVPDGAAWDAGYFDKLSDSHCIVPIRITFPPGYDGSSLAGVRMHCWDNNHPDNANCYVDFRVEASGETRFCYIADGAVKFDSNDGITLATSSLGEYLLRDLDLPFSGPLGLTRFVFEFLLSPATLQVVDELGRVAGRSGSQILSEIPGSHPAYLVPDAMMLPRATGLARRITGTATGTYTYASLAPEDTSIAMMDVPTRAGEVDRLLANADVTRVRFIPGAPKTAPMTMARRISGHARGISIEGFQAAPTNELDVTASPDMSLIRLTNTGPAARIDVKLLDFNTSNSTKKSVARTQIPVPTGQDLVVAVTNWPGLAESTVTTQVVPPS